MKKIEKLKNVLSVKILFIFFIAYSLFIVTYIKDMYMLNNSFIAKSSIYLLLFLCSFIVFVFLLNIKHKKIVKIIATILIMSNIIFTWPELSLMCKNGLNISDFFINYSRRMNDVYNYTDFSDKMFNYLNRFELAKSANKDIKYLNGLVSISSDKKDQLFNKINTGLSDVEDRYVWTSDCAVRIPVYIDEDIIEGEIVIQYVATTGSDVYYSANGRKREYMPESNKNNRIIIPFEKDKGENVVMIKLIIPDAQYMLDKNGKKLDNRKLGLAIEFIGLAKYKK